MRVTKMEQKTTRVMITVLEAKAKARVRKEGEKRGEERQQNTAGALRRHWTFFLSGGDNCTVPCLVSERLSWEQMQGVVQAAVQ